MTREHTVDDVMFLLQEAAPPDVEPTRAMAEEIHALLPRDGETVLSLAVRLWECRKMLAARPVAAEPPSLVAAIRAKIEAMPTREEWLGGQRTKYLNRDEVLGWLVWTPAQPEPAAPEWKPRYNRETAHCTFNGGHHEDCCRAAFHHGMDTVFNLIESDSLLPASSPAAQSITPEIRTKLDRAIKESERLSGPIAHHKPFEFHAMKGEPHVIVCRSRDQHGRRITDFLSLNCSPGLNVSAIVETLIAALQRAPERAYSRVLPCGPGEGVARNGSGHARVEAE